MRLSKITYLLLFMILFGFAYSEKSVYFFCDSSIDACYLKTEHFLAPSSQRYIAKYSDVKKFEIAHVYEKKYKKRKIYYTVEKYNEICAYGENSERFGCFFYHKESENDVNQNIVLELNKQLDEKKTYIEWGK